MDRTREEQQRNETVPVAETSPHATPELHVDEFSIVELEDRLEFLERCETNCGCPPPPP